MKTIRNTTAALAVFGLIIISGCSENSVTPGEFSSKKNSSGMSNKNFPEQKLSSFDLSVKLNPGDSYTLKRDEANLESFRIISLKNCNPDQLRITSSTIDSEVGCYWEGYNGFGLEDITIENVGKTRTSVFGNIYGVTIKK